MILKIIGILFYFSTHRYRYRAASPKATGRAIYTTAGGHTRCNQTTASGHLSNLYHEVRRLLHE